MCNFFSCIVTKTGHVLYDPMSDSHEDIIDKYKEQHDLTDDTTDPEKLRFARVEITPPNIDVFAPVDQWVLTIDQRITPAWWSEVFVQTAMICLSEFLSTAILVGKEISELTSGRFWARDCRIDKLTGTALVVRLESSQVREMLGSSQVGVMRGSSQVGEMRESSQVREMLGSSQVGVMRESSQVGEMWGSSQVGVMRESSQVGEMWGSSQVREMRESSQVGEMWGSSQVGVMWGSSQVGVMRESSQVGVHSSEVNYVLNDNAIAIINITQTPKIITVNEKIQIELQEGKRGIS